MSHHSNAERGLGDMQVVILAGGFGTRLAEKTDELPKPMVEVGGKPILWHILKIYSHHGFNNFVIACGYKAEAIKRFFLEYRDRTSDLFIDYPRNSVERIDHPGTIDPWRIGLIDTGPETLTGGRLKRLAPHLGSRTFLMTYGDGVSDVDLQSLVAFHRSHGKLATFTAVHPPPRFGLPEIDEQGCVRAFAEKPATAGEWINGGFFILEPGVMDYIENDATSFETDSLAALARDGQLMAYRHEGFWHPMDTLRDLRNLNRMWTSNEAPWNVWSEHRSIVGRIEADRPRTRRVGS